MCQESRSGLTGWVFKKFFNVYLLLRDRERQSMSMGGAERGGDTESEVGSRLWAVSTEPDAGLELTNRKIMTWAEVGRLTDWATQVPLLSYVFIKPLSVLISLLITLPLVWGGIRVAMDIFGYSAKYLCTQHENTQIHKTVNNTKLNW